MKHKFLTTMLAFTCSVMCLAQGGASLSLYDRHRPAYYELLSSLSPRSESKGAELDKLTFPYDAAAAEKRLSLKPYYLEGVTLQDFQIPSPPANSSEQTRAELNYLLHLQNHRSPYDVQSSLAMAGIYYKPRITEADSSYHAYRKNLFHIGRAIGNWFNPQDLPATADLMANVWRDASYFIWGFKYKFLRVRPYLLETSLENLEETDWAAYPSGHAANSYINAYIFSNLSPENSDYFFHDAYDMAHSREILGVHYPSDSESARQLAKQFVQKLFSSPKFLSELTKVKEEWARKKENLSRPPIVPAWLKSPSCQPPKPVTNSCAKKCQ